MCAILALVQANGRHPLIKKAGVLPGAEVSHVINPTGEDEVIQRASAPLQPYQQALTRFGHELELNRPTCFLLDNGCSVADGAAADQIANAQFHQVAPAQFAVDGQVEQGSVSQSLVFVEVKPDCLDVARSLRAFRVYILPRIPRAPCVHGEVKIGMHAAVGTPCLCARQDGP